MKSVLFLLLFASMAMPVLGQTLLNVATKVEQNTKMWKHGYELIVSCEKADVVVLPADTNVITVVAELSAKHPSADTAALDVESWRFAVRTVGKKVFVTVFIEIGARKSLPVSNMKAKITLYAPKACPLTLTNKFGKARIEELTGPVVLEGSFCNFQLTHLEGPVTIQAEYGSVNARQIRGNLTVASKRAEISLDSVAGTCKINAAYAHVKIHDPGIHRDLLVKADKADVFLQLSSLEHYNFNLKTSYGSIEAPLDFQLTHPTPDNVTATLVKSIALPFVQIESNFGKILINKI